MKCLLPTDTCRAIDELRLSWPRTRSIWRKDPVFRRKPTPAQAARGECGTVNHCAIDVLKDIIGWYRIKRNKDDATGQIVGEERLFDGKSLQKDYAQWGEARTSYFTAAYSGGILADWLAILDKIDAASPFLFVSEYGLALDPYRWGRRWDKYRQRAGIERRIRRHDLRHFSSTAHDRVDTELSKKIIGHHTNAAHAIYSHRESEELRHAHDRANPVGPILVRLSERKATAEAAVSAAAQKPKRTKVSG